MWRTLVDLWKGNLPLSRAFWEFAIFYGLMANIASTGAMFAAIASGASTAVVLVLHLLPSPYWIFSCIGAWRSAMRNQGESRWAAAARYALPVWLLFMLVS
ncbi:MAG: hypothetical protein AB7S41_04895 [Parvibaculaceae bacterium]